MPTIFEAITAADGARRAERQDARQGRLADLAIRKQDLAETQYTQQRISEQDQLKASTIGGFVGMLPQIPKQQRREALATFLESAEGRGIQFDADDLQGFNETLLPILGDDARLISYARGLGQEIGMPEGPSYNNPMAAVDGATGEEVFIQLGSDGSVRPVEGFRPRPRDGMVTRVTGPDGTVIETGSGSALSSGTRGGAEKEMLSYADTLGTLNRIEQSFDPAYLEYGGQLSAMMSGVKDKAGMQLDPDEKQFLEGYSTLVANTNNALSTVIKQLSGAAVNAAEEQRLRSFIPTAKDGPTEFQTKLREFKRATTMAYMRRAYLLNTGSMPSSVDDLSGVMPLDNVRGAYDRRYNRERNRLEASGMPPEQARQEAFRVTDEVFGL